MAGAVSSRKVLRDSAESLRSSRSRVTSGSALAALLRSVYMQNMADEPYQTTLPTVAAGRAESVSRLRGLATRLEELPLDIAAEVLVLLEPALATFER